MSADHLTAAELGITYWEHQALQGIRVLLLAGRISVDMRQATVECGSAGCIGGWVEKMSPQAVNNYVLREGYSEALQHLYFPGHSAAWSAGPGAAAAAIDVFLCGAVEDPWGAALRTVRWCVPGEQV